MDLREIRQLIKMVDGSNISELEIEEDGRKLRIAKSAISDNGASRYSTDMHMISAMQQPIHVAAAQPGALAIPLPVKEEPAPAANIFEIRSPMVGTFYRAPSPDADPYVEIGQSVSVGQPLCIVEAMKLLNEIESEVAGKIIKILIENAQPVEYNQVLFLIEKI